MHKYTRIIRKSVADEIAARTNNEGAARTSITMQLMRKRTLQPAIAVNADGEVVYRGVNDRIWKTKLRKKSPEEILFGIQTTRAGTATSARARVRVLFQYGTGKGTYPELRRCDCCY